MINKTIEIVCKELAVNASEESEIKYKINGTTKVNDTQDKSIEQNGVVFSQHTGAFNSFFNPGVNAVISTYTLVSFVTIGSFSSTSIVPVSSLAPGSNCSKSIFYLGVIVQFYLVLCVYQMGWTGDGSVSFIFHAMHSSSSNNINYNKANN
jgi:hypothetical protein